jgi:hypothetical protein
LLISLLLTKARRQRFDTANHALNWLNILFSKQEHVFVYINEHILDAKIEKEPIGQVRALFPRRRDNCARTFFPCAPGRRPAYAARRAQIPEEETPQVRIAPRATCENRSLLSPIMTGAKSADRSSLALRLSDPAVNSVIRPEDAM